VTHKPSTPTGLQHWACITGTMWLLWNIPTCLSIYQGTAWYVPWKPHQSQNRRNRGRNRVQGGSSSCLLGLSVVVTPAKTNLEWRRSSLFLIANTLLIILIAFCNLHPMTTHLFMVAIALLIILIAFYNLHPMTTHQFLLGKLVQRRSRSTRATVLTRSQ